MLHEPAEGPELNAAPVEYARALVDAVRMRGAAQVRVEGGEEAELAVAQHALVRVAVERALGRPLVLHGGVAAGVLAVAALDEPPRVGDDAPAVRPDRGAVHRLARHARAARPALPVRDEVRVGDEAAAAVASGAHVRAGLVDRRAQVVVEVALAREDALARHAVEVLLPVVLV